MGDVIKKEDTRTLRLRARIKTEAFGTDLAKRDAEFWIGPFESYKEEKLWKEQFEATVGRQHDAECTSLVPLLLNVFQVRALKLMDPRDNLPFDFGPDLARIIYRHNPKRA